MELLNSSEMDKLSYEIFSILESKFLFDSLPQTPVKTPKSDTGGGASGGKVRILSIDGGVGACDNLLAAVSLARLESNLKSRSGNPTARIADFFDVAAGSGAGGVLTAMLFTRGADGKPLFSAAEALAFLSKNQRLISSVTNKKGLIRGLFRKSSGIFRQTFGEATLRDTVKPVLIPCFDLASGAPFVFSRADAIETDAYDFKISDACAATCADRAVEMSSVDGRTKIVALGGGVAMENPTSAAITHVLNNKMEFPFANGVEDLVVVSLGSGGDWTLGSTPPSTVQLVKMAGSAAADTVDQAVAMAFGHNRASNYVRIQASNSANKKKKKDLVRSAEEMLTQRSVDTVLFRGKMISQQSNAEKLENSCAELVKEQEMRKWNLVPTVVMKQATTPRSSSATISTIATTTTLTSASP